MPRRARSRWSTHGSRENTRGQHVSTLRRQGWLAARADSPQPKQGDFCEMAPRDQPSFQAPTQSQPPHKGRQWLPSRRPHSCSLSLCPCCSFCLESPLPSPLQPLCLAQASTLEAILEDVPDFPAILALLSFMLTTHTPVHVPAECLDGVLLRAETVAFHQHLSGELSAMAVQNQWWYWEHVQNERFYFYTMTIRFSPTLLPWSCVSAIADVHCISQHILYQTSLLHNICETDLTIFICKHYNPKTQADILTCNWQFLKRQALYGHFNNRIQSFLSPMPTHAHTRARTRTLPHLAYISLHIAADVV